MTASIYLRSTTIERRKWDKVLAVLGTLYTALAKMVCNWKFGALLLLFFQRLSLFYLAYTCLEISRKRCTKLSSDSTK